MPKLLVSMLLKQYIDQNFSRNRKSLELLMQQKIENMQQILVVDFGGQTAHLICRRLRDLGVYAQIISPQTPVFEWFEAEFASEVEQIKGLILSGSPFSVYEADAPQPHPQILALAAMVPTLGICYGLHWLAQRLGGQVEALEHKEYGPNPVRIVRQNSSLLQGVAESFLSWMSHADSLKNLPPHFELLGESEQGLPAIICSKELKTRELPFYREIENALPQAWSAAQKDRIAAGTMQIYGLQFHPELSHCEFGQQFLTNFATQICRCASDWRLDIWEQARAVELREQVGADPVVLLISGGVDSSVVAAFLLRHLDAEQVHLLYFDTGLMRLGETDAVLAQLQQLGAKYVHKVDARKEFLAALCGVSDPEQKRSIIGDLFVRIQSREVQKILADLAGVRKIAGASEYYLAQGTLYTDMIESGQGVGQYAAVIKSHHNVGTPLVQALREQGRLVEPLVSLYKDEVRNLGKRLGLSESVTQRQPFPGPGLAIRILGELAEEKLDLLREVDQLYLETLEELGVLQDIWQAFAVLLPVNSVGVAGDSRRYGPVIALRAITSVDGMSAEVYAFEHEQLKKISTRISNRFPDISRVVYDISAKPPATIEWE